MKIYKSYVGNVIALKEQKFFTLQSPALANKYIENWKVHQGHSVIRE